MTTTTTISFNEIIICQVLFSFALNYLIYWDTYSALGVVNVDRLVDAQDNLIQRLTETLEDPDPMESPHENIETLLNEFFSNPIYFVRNDENIRIILDQIDTIESNLFNFSMDLYYRLIMIREQYNTMIEYREIQNAMNIQMNNSLGILEREGFMSEYNHISDLCFDSTDTVFNSYEELVLNMDWVNFLINLIDAYFRSSGLA